MKHSLLVTFLLCFALLSSNSQAAFAQASTAETGGYIPWFTVKNKLLVVQNGSKTTPLEKDVTLPNGIRVEYRTQSIMLTNGSRVHLKEGDLLSLNGEFIQKNPVAAVEPAPIAHAAPAAFMYRPTAPVNGKLRGVVELGASGFNMFIIQIDEKRNWKLEKSEFGNSLVMENMASTEDVRNGLKAYIGKMLDYGVPGRDIHFVVSSGAALADGTRRIVKGLEALKYVVTTVTPEQEGALGLQAALPTAFSGKAFVLDMGSANSKISWLEKGQTKVADTYGSKYYEKGIGDADVAAEVKAKAQQVPAKLRGTCFIIGGVPYELAKAVRQGQEPYTTLHAPNTYPQFTGAKVKSGLNIYQAVAEATGCQQFVFGYDSNFTIGYLLSLP